MLIDDVDNGRFADADAYARAHGFADAAALHAAMDAALDAAAERIFHILFGDTP